MLKILVINGSPKRGASFTMTAARPFVEGMLAAGDCEAEYIDLADLDIKPCRGCLSCWGRTPGECSIKNDGMSLIREKLSEADIVIESYPLYFFGMPGPVKTFTDRLLSAFEPYVGEAHAKEDGIRKRLRAPKAGQRFVLICSCGFSEGVGAFEPLKKQYDLILGENGYTAIFCPQIKALVESGSKRRLDAFTSAAREAGRQFIADGAIDEKTLHELTKEWFSKQLYGALAGKFWQDQEAGGQNSKDNS